jgi:YHS domain-containing protein
MAEQHQDLIDMIEVLSTSIDIQTREENFYRRSAGASSSDVARSLFLEIADDSTRYRKSLEDRREKLQEALNDSKVVKGNGMGRKVVGEEHDPVCHMKVDRKKCQLVSIHMGKEYRFCSSDCKRAFDLDPGKYTRG